MVPLVAVKVFVVAAAPFVVPDEVPGHHLTCKVIISNCRDPLQIGT